MTAMYLAPHPPSYSNVSSSNNSSISPVPSAHSSTEHLNVTYKVAAENPHLYRPVRPLRSRLRPALPSKFLQLPGQQSDNTPWRKRADSDKTPCVTYIDRSAQPSPISRDKVLLRELADAIEFVHDSGSLNSASSAGTISSPFAASPSNMQRFTTCFGPASVVSLVDPQMMSLRSTNAPQATATTVIPNRTVVGHHTMPADNLLREKPLPALKPWKTPTSEHAPTRRISCEMQPATPDGFTEVTSLRSFSSCSMRRPEGIQSQHSPDDILHIQLPPSDSNGYKASQKRKGFSCSDDKMEKLVQKEAKRVEVNLRIRLEEPSARTCATELDGLFGVGKEESKAGRCGYAGLGIASDKKTWKATDDYQTLLRDNVRSSLYNFALRSPRMSMRRKGAISPSFSPYLARSPASSPRLATRPAEIPSTLSSPPRARKAPPPPLDLTKVSAFASLSSAKIAQKRSTTKGDRQQDSKPDKRIQNPLDGEIDKRTQPEAVVPPRSRKLTFRGILRSVKSISSLKGSK